MAVIGRFARLALDISRHAGVIDRDRLKDWLRAASGVLDGEGGTIGPFNTVATGAAGSGRLLDVTAQQLAVLDTGATVWVKSQKDTWRWEPGRSDTADNVKVCNPTANGSNSGRFLRSQQASPAWRAQAAWYIDSVSGNDENTGASGFPLKTWAELATRCGLYGGTKLDSPLTINILRSLLATDSLNFDVILGRKGALNFQGTRTLVGTGTFSAVTAAVAATQTPDSATSAIAGGWAPHVKRMAVITASAIPSHVNATSWVTKDLTGGAARFLPWTVPALQSTFLYGTIITPSVGDTFEIYTLPDIPIGHCNAIPGDQYYPTTGFELDQTLQASSLNFISSFATSEIKTGGNLTHTLFGCCFNGVCLYNVVTWASQLIGGCFVHGGSIEACLLANDGFNSVMQVMPANDVLFIGRGTLSQGLPAFFTNGATYVNVTSGNGLGVFDSPSRGLLVSPGGVLNCTGPLWGNGNSTYGIDVQGGGNVLYNSANKPIITGTTNDTLVGGTAKAYAAIPFADTTKLATISVST